MQRSLGWTVALTMAAVAACGSDNEPATGQTGKSALLIVVVEDPDERGDTHSGARFELVFDGRDTISRRDRTGQYQTLRGGSRLFAGADVKVEAHSTDDGIDATVFVDTIDELGDDTGTVGTIVLDVDTAGGSDADTAQLDGDRIAYAELRWVDDDAFALSGDSITLDPTPSNASVEVGVTKPSNLAVGFIVGTGRPVSTGEIELTNVEIDSNGSVDYMVTCRAHVPSGGTLPLGQERKIELEPLRDGGSSPSSCEQIAEATTTIDIDLQVTDGGGVDAGSSTERLSVSETLSTSIRPSTSTWEVCAGGETRAVVSVEHFMHPNEATPYRANVAIEQFEGATCSSTDSDGRIEDLVVLDPGMSDRIDVDIRAGNFLGGDDTTIGSVTVGIAP